LKWRLRGLLRPDIENVSCFGNLPSRSAIFRAGDAVTVRPIELGRQGTDLPLDIGYSTP
jgi:hypothetical protein